MNRTPHRATLGALVLQAAVSLTTFAQEGTHVPRIDRLEALQAKSDGAQVQFVVTVFDEADDMDLASVAGRAYVFCSNEAFGLSLGAPDKVVRKDRTTNTIWISNGQPGIRVIGSCELSVYVQDKAGNKSATVKVPIEFK